MNKSKLIAVTKILVLMCIVGFSTVSCSYDDFVNNEFTFTSVYLPKAKIDRTFIIEDGMKIGVGVVLGGRLNNTENVEVTFSLNDNLVTASGLTVLPSSYYSLVDEAGNAVTNKIIIPAGKVQGFVYVKANAAYLADPVSLGNKYALGFQLDNVVKADSILATNKTSVITFSYINKQYGNYIQTGKYVKTVGTTVTTATYPGAITDAVSLTMVAPSKLTYNALATFRGTTQKMNITIATDNKITIESIAGSVAVIDDGGSFYDPVTHKITLNYSFVFNGENYKANDVLEFRNRVVDEVNVTTY